jgi:hypothetical protein
MEGLDTLINLNALNLSNNFVERIEGLDNCPNLATLNVKSNRIATVEDVKGILACQELGVLDISDNAIKDEKVLDLLQTLPKLKVLYFKGNPLCKTMRNYRKNIILRFPLLTYLDDRPVFETERLMVTAWGQGGVEAERAERKRQFEEKERKELEQYLAFKKMCDDAKAKKREQGLPVEASSDDDIKVSDSSDDEEEKTEEVKEKVPDLEEKIPDLEIGIKTSNPVEVDTSIKTSNSVEVDTSGGCRNAVNPYHTCVQFCQDFIDAQRQLNEVKESKKAWADEAKQTVAAPIEIPKETKAPETWADRKVAPVSTKGSAQQPSSLLITEVLDDHDEETDFFGKASEPLVALIEELEDFD